MYTDQNQWSEHLLKLVWQKGIIIPNYPKEQYRLDTNGRIMQFDHFESTKEYSWRIIRKNQPEKKCSPNTDSNLLEPISNKI